METWNPNTSIPKSAMANTHAVGEPFAAVQTQSEDHIEINVTDVQIRDEVSLLDLSVLDHEDRENLQRELDSSGKLLPVKINYIKYAFVRHRRIHQYGNRTVRGGIVFWKSDENYRGEWPNDLL